MTSVGTVKDRLVTILTAALPSSQVIVGPPDVTTVRQRACVVGGSPAENGQESIPMELRLTNFDGSSSDAIYTLTITVSVSLPGTDESKAEDMAVADFNAAVAAIQADQALGLDANFSATVTGAGELLESSSASGRSAAVRFPVVIYTTL